MRTSCALAAALAGLLLAAPARAAMEDGLSDSQMKTIDRFIDRTIQSKPSGTGYVERIGRGVTVTVAPEGAISASTGLLCGNDCSDPCRTFALRVESGDGTSIREYSGRRCAVLGDPSTWRADGPLELRRVLSSGPDPEKLRRAGSFLAALSYLDAGAPDAAGTMSALETFRRDAELSTKGRDDVTEADLSALRDTVNRSGRRGRCAVQRSAAYSACDEAPF